MSSSEATSLSLMRISKLSLVGKVVGNENFWFHSGFNVLFKVLVLWLAGLEESFKRQ
jgi:hypothetical protein